MQQQEDRASEEQVDCKVVRIHSRSSEYNSEGKEEAVIF